MLCDHLLVGHVQLKDQLLVREVWCVGSESESNLVLKSSHPSQVDGVDGRVEVSGKNGGAEIHDQPVRDTRGIGVNERVGPY